MRHLVCLAAVLAAFVVPVHARSAFTPTRLPYSCDAVRGAFAVASREHLEKIAKELGVVVTPSQRREIRKCLAQAD